MSQTTDSRLTSEEEYRNIFEAASEALVIYGIEIGLVVEANPAACEMYGYTRQEFVGLNPAVFMQPESHVLFREHIQMAEPGGVWESLVVHIHRDGSPFHAEVRRSVINYRASRAC